MIKTELRKLLEDMEMEARVDPIARALLRPHIERIRTIIDSIDSFMDNELPALVKNESCDRKHDKN